MRIYSGYIIKAFHYICGAFIDFIIQYLQRKFWRQHFLSSDIEKRIASIRIQTKPYNPSICLRWNAIDQTRHVTGYAPAKKTGNYPSDIPKFLKKSRVLQKTIGWGMINLFASRNRYVSGQISEHIFAPNGGRCLYIS